MPIPTRMGFIDIKESELMEALGLSGGRILAIQPNELAGVFSFKVEHPNMPIVRQENDYLMHKPYKDMKTGKLT